MKKRRIFFVYFITLVVLLVTACGSSKKYGSSKDTATQEEPYKVDVIRDEESYDGLEGDADITHLSSDDAKSDSLTQKDYQGDVSNENTPEDINGEESKELSDTKIKESNGISNASTVDSSSNTALADNNRKLIRKIYLDIETLEYDNLMNSIGKQIDLLNGYIESSNMDGNKYNNIEQLRYSKMVVKIPKDKVNNFVNTVSKKCNVVSKEESSEDITLDYVDRKSHIESLRIEYQRILTLLKKADKLDDIFTLESKLSELRYEIESYESELRTYDNMVDYSTVTLTITEVKELNHEVVQNKEKSIWERIQVGFKENTDKITNLFLDTIVWIGINIIYIVFAGVIMIVALFGAKRLKKNSQSKMNQIMKVRSEFLSKKPDFENGNKSENSGSKETKDNG